MFTQCYLRVENILLLVNLSLGQLIIELYPGPTVTLSEFKIHMSKSIYDYQETPTKSAVTSPSQPSRIETH